MKNALNPRGPWVVLVFLLLFCFPLPGRCCEPVFPLFQLLTSSSLAGPAVLTQSLLWLFVAIVIKCGAFVVLERRLSRKSLGNQSFYASVFRANYITLGVILLVATVKILPQRLRSPDFIAYWLHSTLKALFT